MTELKSILFQAAFYAFVNKSRIGQDTDQPVRVRVPMLTKPAPAEGLANATTPPEDTPAPATPQGGCVTPCPRNLGPGPGTWIEARYTSKGAWKGEEEGEGADPRCLDGQVASVGIWDAVWLHSGGGVGHAVLPTAVKLHTCTGCLSSAQGFPQPSG